MFLDDVPPTIEIEVVTVQVCPHPTMFGESDLRAWVCRAHHEIGGETWALVGTGDTPEVAKRDLEALLAENGVEAPIQLNECLDPATRRRLIWSAKSRAMKNLAPIAVVHE